MPAVVFYMMPFAAVAYALVGGVFLAFSDFIMRSLALAPGTGGIDAMLIINREVFRMVFMPLFLGMAVVSLIIAGYAAIDLRDLPRLLMLSAALVYLVGCFGVTAVFNVPMNRALEGLDLSSEATLAYWRETYLPRWTFWNTTRTIACIASATLLSCALLIAT